MSNEGIQEFTLFVSWNQWSYFRSSSTM